MSLRPADDRSAARVRARATDDTGRVQPDQPAWTRGGFANNASDGVRVEVRPASRRGGAGRR